MVVVAAIMVGVAQTNKVSNTVKSRYNGFQGTEENHPLLPKSVIAKITMVDEFLREKKTKEKDPSF